MDLNTRQRFWRKVNRSRHGCWNWTAALTTNGYGQFLLSSNGRGKLNLQRAHRVAYTVFYGEIPDGSVVMHRCDNPACVRPSHLKLGTQIENIADMYRKGRGKNSRGEPVPAKP